MSEPFELSAAQAASAIRGGRLTTVELMESLLARSAALEPSLRVWVTLDEEAAMAAARRSVLTFTCPASADTPRLWAEGKDRSRVS